MMRTVPSQGSQCAQHCARLLGRPAAAGAAAAPRRRPAHATVATLRRAMLWSHAADDEVIPAHSLVLAGPTRDLPRSYVTSSERAELVEPLERQPPPEIELPKDWFPVAGAGETTAVCRAVPVASGRSFGPFRELTLECSSAARAAIDQVCAEGGFTQSWSATSRTVEEILEQGSGDMPHKMTKIPAVVLVKLMLGLPAAEEAAARSLVGAWSICMEPDRRTCMNVVVGRRQPAGPDTCFVLDKFSLYYPDNGIARAEWGDRWDLLGGFSFRTAVLQGTLNRGGLRSLGTGGTTARSCGFSASEHGLVVDAASAYEDCAYVPVQMGVGGVGGETREERVRRIDGLVEAMVAAYGPREGDEQGLLRLSFDPVERAQGVSALESEWNLLKQHLSRP